MFKSTWSPPINKNYRNLKNLKHNDDSNYALMTDMK